MKGGGNQAGGWTGRSARFHQAITSFQQLLRKSGIAWSWRQFYLFEEQTRRAWSSCGVCQTSWQEPWTGHLVGFQQNIFKLTTDTSPLMSHHGRKLRKICCQCNFSFSAVKSFATLPAAFLTTWWSSGACFHPNCPFRLILLNGHFKSCTA